jgi:hypothetical protein
MRNEALEVSEDELRVAEGAVEDAERGEELDLLHWVPAPHEEVEEGVDEARRV